MCEGAFGKIAAKVIEILAAIYGYGKGHLHRELYPLKGNSPSVRIDEGNSGDAGCSQFPHNISLLL